MQRNLTIGVRENDSFELKSWREFLGFLLSFLFAVLVVIIAQTFQDLLQNEQDLFGVRFFRDHPDHRNGMGAVVRYQEWHDNQRVLRTPRRLQRHG